MSCSNPYLIGIIEICFLNYHRVFRRDSWTLHSTCGLWQQLVDQTKEEAKQKMALADLYAARLTVLIVQRADDLQRISRKV